MAAPQACPVMPATRNQGEQTAATALLNPLAREFVPAVGRALNPMALDFVPVAVGAPALNPLAGEFVPWWHIGGGLSADAPVFFVTPQEIYYPAADVYSFSSAIPPTTWRSSINNYSRQGRARFTQRFQRTNNEEFVRRTIYISNFDQTVTEEKLAQVFGRCGTGYAFYTAEENVVVDCRVCGDPTSGFRFAFLEFQFEEDAFDALRLDGFIVGVSPLKVAPSKTAIMPIKSLFLPQSEEEKERSSRTVYCTNIEKTVTPSELIHLCQQYFGPVSLVRIMGDENHATQIAFIEFMEASSAIDAFSSSGINVKGLLVRVSPSKTPIR